LNKIITRIKSLLNSDLNKKIFNHSFWILCGNIISKFALLLATIIMARYMGNDEYGQFGIIKSTILMFAMFAGLELGMTATKYIAQYLGHDNSKIERIIGLSNLFAIILSLFISGAVYLYSDLIAMQIAAPQLTYEIKISSFILFFSSINGIQTGILNGLQRFREVSIINAFAGVVSAILLILSAIYGNLDTVVFAFGANFIVLFLLNYFVLKKYFYNVFKINIFNLSNFKEIEVLWKFSLPAIFAGMMIGPITWACNYLLVNTPNGYAEMANFDIANQWRTTILFIPAAISQIALPLLASSINDKQSYNIVFRKNLKINFFIGLFFSIVLLLITPFIVKLYGQAYNGAFYPMIIMFITTVFISVNNVIGQVIASQGRMWLGFMVNFLWGIVLLGLSYVFIDYYNLGAIGISLAYLISYIFHTCIQFIFVKRFL